MSIPPPVDLDEFRSAMRDAGIEEIVEPMLELFVTEAAKGMAVINDAMAAGNLDALGRAAHSMKSSAGNVRAKTLAAALQELETAAVSGDRAAASRLLGAVAAQHAAALAFLAERRKTG
jgi:HPt (histidine-containing phosphotransfer) domain-containing protein